MSRSTTTILGAGVAALALTLSACGGGTPGATPGGGDTTTGAAQPTVPTPFDVSSIQADPALAALVPAKVKSAGTIKVGTDASYAPNEFLADDGKTPQGMDVDLFNAVAAKMGMKAEFNNAGFDSIILGVNSGKFDVGVSSFTINPERKTQVNMVSYFSAGTQWVVAKGNPKKVDPASACGLNVGVQKGTVQVDDLDARNKKCAADGKPAINVIIEEQQSKVTTDLQSGKVDAMLADSPIALYAVAMTGGTLEPVGDIYDSAPYGFVVPKGETEFAGGVAKALESLKADGTYDKILERWGNKSGAITEFKVNP